MIHCLRDPETYSSVLIPKPVLAAMKARMPQGAISPATALPASVDPPEHTQVRVPLARQQEYRDMVDGVMSSSAHDFNEIMRKSQILIAAYNDMLLERDDVRHASPRPSPRSAGPSAAQPEAHEIDTRCWRPASCLLGPSFIICWRPARVCATGRTDVAGASGDSGRIAATIETALQKRWGGASASAWVASEHRLAIGARGRVRQNDGYDA